ncbi:hypothetical protein L873DRAFT_1821363, partial [Choiromyces venosus 120613-1]
TVEKGCEREERKRGCEVVARKRSEGIVFALLLIVVKVRGVYRCGSGTKVESSWERN